MGARCWIYLSYYHLYSRNDKTAPRSKAWSIYIRTVLYSGITYASADDKHWANTNKGEPIRFLGYSGHCKDSYVILHVKTRAISLTKNCLLMRIFITIWKTLINSYDPVINYITHSIIISTLICKFISKSIAFFLLFSVLKLELSNNSKLPLIPSEFESSMRSLIMMKRSYLMTIAHIISTENIRLD